MVILLRFCFNEYKVFYLILMIVVNEYIKKIYLFGGLDIIEVFFCDFFMGNWLIV